jgi:hypothetical protein
MYEFSLQVFLVNNISGSIAMACGKFATNTFHKAAVSDVRGTEWGTGGLLL